MYPRLTHHLMAVLLSVAFTAELHAKTLNPLDFTPLGAFNVTNGGYIIDTDALTITETNVSSTNLLFTGVIDDQDGTADSFGPGASVTNVGPLGIPHIAVFTFDGLTIAGTANITVTGHRALGLLSHSDIVIDRTLDLSGGYPRGGPGGFDGGFADSSGAQDGFGPGGGGAVQNGGFGLPNGGAAGFGSAGIENAQTGTAGLAYGDLKQVLQGGSGGGGIRSLSPLPAAAHGGGGGGALEISAIGYVQLGTNSVLRANGSPGVMVNSTARSGAGSGGGIRITGRDISLQGIVRANGTNQGFSYSGGGRVLVYGLGLYIVGTAYDPVAAVSGILVKHGYAGGTNGVIQVAPFQRSCWRARHWKLGHRHFR